VLDFGLSSVFDDAKDLSDRDLFWQHTVVFGYQPAETEDADPDSELPTLGETPENPAAIPPWEPLGYSVIFVENIRDWAWKGTPDGLFTVANRLKRQTEYWSYLHGIVAHEIGHAPGRNGESTDHAEGLLLQKGWVQFSPNALGARFAPQTMTRFRSASRWTR
jgi:hypothetical protein